MTPSLLAGWDNFFVIMGSAAAGLTGLTFIVITLSAQAGRANFGGLRVFVTPTIVHFCAVLGLAAFLSMPRQNALSAGLGLGGAGAIGLIYTLWIAVSLRRMRSTYRAVLEDWLWHVVVPALSYGALAAVPLCVRQWPTQIVYGVAAALVLLILSGIHNAWDIAVWNSIRPQNPAPGDQKPG